MEKAKQILKDRKREKKSYSDTWYKLTGLRVGDEAARKYISGLDMYFKSIDNGEIIEKSGKRLSIEINADGTQTSNILVNLIDKENKTPIEILEMHGYDPIQWELVKHTLKAWNVYSVKDKTTNLFSSTIVVKPLESRLTMEIIKSVYESLREFDGKIYERNIQEGSKLLELPVFDLHLGKFSWSPETGEDYDLDVAVELYRKTVDTLLYKASKHPIEKIMLPFGNDFFHYDSHDNKTTAGTPQDTDTRWQKMYRVGCELIVETVSKCLEVAPVDILYVPSNHDFKMGFFAVYNLYTAYKNHPDVKVDISPKTRKYYQYGKCMIGLTHGDKEKSRIDKLMQAEAPEMWGETIYREWHLGHLHSEQVTEVPGVIIRHMSSITATDAWHYQSGYVKAIRKAQAIIWDKEFGKEATFDSNVMSLVKVDQ